MEQQIPNVRQQNNEDVNQIPITFRITIGEINAIAGIANSGAFKSVMQPTLEEILAQVRSQNIPGQPTQEQALKVEVPITLKVGEVNSIFGVINSSSFVTVMKPTLDKINEYAKMYIDQVQQQQPAASPLGQLSLPNQPNVAN